MVLYFNPECSKCNAALDLLNTNNCEVEIRNYLANPPSVNELKQLVTKLSCNVRDIIRTKEPLFLEKFEGKRFTDDEWYEVLSSNPLLIERPILISGDKAVIGRPPERILQLAVK